MSSRARWTAGHDRLCQGPIKGIGSASYALARLSEARLVDPGQAARFLESTGLADFAWQATWAVAVGSQPADGLAQADGCVVLIHGWDGSRAIWEDIPARICLGNPRLFVLAPDVNGFGGSPFADTLPSLATCAPVAVMRAVEGWTELLGLRSGPRAHSRYRVLTFVGHSMGGAATFYLTEGRWRPHEVARLAVAPALLLNDMLRQEFYKALGLSIWAGSPAKALDWLKDWLAPRLIESLIGDASQTVKDEHLRIFNSTPRGTLAQTFYAMGAAPQPVPRRRWQHFRVLLGHRDRLVGVAPMLLLLEKLGFVSDCIDVVLGDHYLFSVGRKSRRLHTPNRDLLVRRVLELHQECRQAQRGQAR